MSTKELEEKTMAFLFDMVNGYASPVVMDNLQMKLETDDEDDPYDCYVTIRKWVNGKWDLIETFYMCKYVTNGFLTYDRMLGDITACVKTHYESPKKKSWD